MQQVQPTRALVENISLTWQLSLKVKSKRTIWPWSCKNRWASRLMTLGPHLDISLTGLRSANLFILFKERASSSNRCIEAPTKAATASRYHCQLTLFTILQSFYEWILAKGLIWLASLFFHPALIERSKLFR